MNYQDAKALAIEITSTWKLGPTTDVWTKFLQHECAHETIAGNTTRNLRREPHSSMDTGTWFNEYLRLVRLNGTSNADTTHDACEACHGSGWFSYWAHNRRGTTVSYAGKCPTVQTDEQFDQVEHAWNTYIADCKLGDVEPIEREWFNERLASAVIDGYV